MEKITDKTESTDWVRLYTKDLFAWAFRKTSDRKLSEDLVQGSFLADDGMASFFDKNGRWTPSSAPQPWQGKADNLTDLPAFKKVLDGCIEHLPYVMNACIRLKFLDEKRAS